MAIPGYLVNESQREATRFEKESTMYKDLVLEGNVNLISQNRASSVNSYKALTIRSLEEPCKLKRDRHGIQEGKKNPDQTRMLCLPALPHWLMVPTGSLLRKMKGWTQCSWLTSNVHLSPPHSKVYVIPTLVSFFVLLIKSRVKNKNKNLERKISESCESDLSCSEFIPTLGGRIQGNGPHFRALFEQG